MIRTIPAERLQPNPIELAARLQSRIPVEGVETYLKNLQEVITCRYSYQRVPIIRSGNSLDLGFQSTQSRSLTKNLEGCREAFLFAVTLGIGVDRLLMRLSASDLAGHFITDALASALADAACDEAEREIRGALNCTKRYSPGYGDLPLNLQEPLLQFLQGQKLGITLTKNLLMVPTKSITAIMGIKDENKPS